MPNIFDVANYFLTTLGTDEESDLTHLKMQKLCAYAQGLSLSLLDRPLFLEELEAWKHGPVVASLYDKFKECGKLPLPPIQMSEIEAREPFDDEQKFILEITKEYYGSKSAPTLWKISHQDFPGKFKSKEVISREKIKANFAHLPIVQKLKAYTPPASIKRFYSEAELLNALRD